MLNSVQIEYAVIGMLVAIVILFLIVIYQFTQLNYVKKNYTHLMRGVSDGNVEEILLEYIDKTGKLGARLTNNEEQLNELQRLLNSRAARVSIERYNAYEETGNDLSFSIALMNDHYDGFVITSLYNRYDQRVYAKPLVRGESRYPLTNEEKQVISQAMQL